MIAADDPVAAVEAEVAWRLERGDALTAFDRAAAAHRDGLDSARLCYLMVRALAASGDSMGAMALYERLGLAASDDVDCVALAGRIWKDAAFDHAGARRTELLARAAAAYERAFALSGAAFPAINAASLCALLGDRARVAALARPIAMAGAGEDYWEQATLAEALLLTGRGAEARQAAEAACAVAARRIGDRAATCRQIARLAAAGAIDGDGAAAVIEVLRPPPVGVYCGRMFRAGGAGEASARAAIAAALDAQPLSALIGPLACGADILFAEEAMARDIDLSVVLPFAEEDFIAQSVVSGGADWLPRYEACRAGAATVHLASGARYVGDDG